MGGVDVMNTILQPLVMMMMRIYSLMTTWAQTLKVETMNMWVSYSFFL